MVEQEMMVVNYSAHYQVKANLKNMYALSRQYISPMN